MKNRDFKVWLSEFRNSIADYGYYVDFRKIYPGIKFEIISKSTADLVEMLETRNLDLIVDTLPINSKKNVTKVTLSKLYNCFAYNKKILKDVEINQVDDLKNYPLILPSATSSIRLKLDEYMESRNAKLNWIFYKKCNRYTE